MRRFSLRVQGLFVGLVLGATIAAGTAAPIPGPQDVGQIYNVLNATVMNWLTVNANGGELQLLGPNSFKANGSVATTMTSLGPIGAHTTVQRWMVVMTPGGIQGYVPVY